MHHIYRPYSSPTGGLPSKVDVFQKPTCATAHIEQSCHGREVSQCKHCVIQDSCCSCVHLEKWVGWHPELEVFQRLCQVWVPKQECVRCLVCCAPRMSTVQQFSETTSIYVLPPTCLSVWDLSVSWWWLWILMSFRMWHPVLWQTDTSLLEALAASIFRVLHKWWQQVSLKCW
jgi:hypothetical protein